MGEVTELFYILFVVVIKKLMYVLQFSKLFKKRSILLYVNFKNKKILKEIVGGLGEKGEEIQKYKLGASGQDGGISRYVLLPRTTKKG